MHSYTKSPQHCIFSFCLDYFHLKSKLQYEVNLMVIMHFCNYGLLKMLMILFIKSYFGNTCVDLR